MKKTILFAIITLTTNAFAQINQPATQMDNSKINPMENARGRMDVTKHSGINSENNLGKSAKMKILKQEFSNYVVDSIYGWNWYSNIGWNRTTKTSNMIYDANNNLVSKLIDNNQILYAYDANNNLTVYIFQIWNGNSWEKYFQTDYKYDANNNMVNSLSQSGSTGVLVNDNQKLNTYDAKDNLTSEIYQSWNGNEWVNILHGISIYDEHNNCINVILQKGDSSSWVNWFTHIYSYDANNNRIAAMGQNWYDTAWIDDWKSIFSYDANNNQIASLSQIWDSSAWINSWYSTYSYDANNNQIASLGQNWDGSAWVKSSQNTSSYNENNKLTSSTDQNWNGYAWELSLQSTSTYYDANNIKSNVSKSFFSDGSIYYGDSTYYYSHIEVTGIPNMEKPDITVYPNPGSGKFTITGNNAISKVEIYNFAGVQVYTDYNFTKQGSKSIDLSALSRGMYFVKVNTGKRVISTKIIIQ